MEIIQSALFSFPSARQNGAQNDFVPRFVTVQIIALYRATAYSAASFIRSNIT